MVLVGLLGLVEAGSSLALGLKPLVWPGDTSDVPPRFQQDAHRGYQEWVPSYVRDARGHGSRYRIGLWEPRPIHSTTINTQGGYRRSWNEPVSGFEPQRRIFMFGGSTVWGLGVADDFTIPSALNRLAAGRNASFVNMGVHGFFSTQEIMKLTLLLARGDTPEAVVLYDGVNDIMNAVYQGPDREMAFSTVRRISGC